MMGQHDRFYFARRAAEEADQALAASDPQTQAAHVKLQRAYVERASIGDRKLELAETIG